ncbi:MAG: adenosine deaminase [Chloroflexi bacterium]|nr:MAG: adenosine deaminase [Chloroflexota bacterium]MBL1196512.1 adenosine deaminase [Chloroflexota bacterium]NOH13808.1 adenosine deaminase [Chloroflexota bacterium]
MIDPQFPFIELHRHLDGAVRLETILDLGRQHNLPLPSFELEELRPHVQVIEPQPGLLAFFEKFEWMVGILVDYDACRRIAYENIEDARNEGIDYIELRFSPTFMAQPHGLVPSGVVEAVVEGVEQGKRDFGVEANLIGIISRTFGQESGMQELDALLSQRDMLVALDLAGDEINYPAELFVEHFNRGRDAGWRITVHAGEAQGADSMWPALRDLGAERIGHGTRALDDPKLMEYLLENRIGLEMNLTSNLQTSTVPDYASHPLKEMLEYGLLVTINSDDPGISAIDLPYEFNVAAPQAGLSEEQIQKAQCNALEIAFLSDEEKQALLAKKAG